MSDPFDFTKIEDMIMNTCGPTKETMSQAFLNAALYGSSAYTIGVDTGRIRGKSVVNMLKPRLTGHWGIMHAGSDMVWFDDYAVLLPSHVHVFPHKGNYMEISPYAKPPKRCIYLQDNQWYSRTKGAGGVQKLEPSQVPKAYRLYLRVCHIDQPGV